MCVDLGMAWRGEEYGHACGRPAPPQSTPRAPYHSTPPHAYQVFEFSLVDGARVVHVVQAKPARRDTHRRRHRWGRSEAAGGRARRRGPGGELFGRGMVEETVEGRVASLAGKEA